MKRKADVNAAQRALLVAEPPRLGNSDWDSMMARLRDWADANLPYASRKLLVYEATEHEPVALYVVQEVYYWIDGTTCIHGKVNHEVNLTRPLMPQLDRIIKRIDEIEAQGRKARLAHELKLDTEDEVLP